MMAAKQLLIVLLVCNLAALSSPAQKRGRRLERDVRILKHIPTVFITFEGYGKTGDTLEANSVGTKSQEPGKYVWLRLHNNTRWVIDIPTTDLFITVGGARVIHPRYQVEEGDGTRAPDNEADKDCGTCGTSLQPGSSALFSILRERLSSGRKIYINFRYKWEYDAGYSPLLEPVHRVEFSGEELSRGVR